MVKFFYFLYISEAIVYKLMVRYLRDIGLENASLHFEDMISVLKNEKSKRILQNLEIYKEVDQFFDEGSHFREESWIIVDLFDDLVLNVMRLMDLPVEDVQRFKHLTQKANKERPTSIKDVICYMQALEFEEVYPLEGEVARDFYAAKLEKQLTALRRMKRRKREEGLWDLKMRLRELYEREAERKRRNKWRP